MMREMHRPDETEWIRLRWSGMLSGNRRAPATILGTSPSGEPINIPPGERLVYVSDVPDNWRRVKVLFGDVVVAISRAAWDNCIEEMPVRPRQTKTRARGKS